MLCGFTILSTLKCMVHPRLRLFVLTIWITDWVDCSCIVHNCNFIFNSATWFFFINLLSYGSGAFLLSSPFLEILLI